MKNRGKIRQNRTKQWKIFLCCQKQVRRRKMPFLAKQLGKRRYGFLQIGECLVEPVHIDFLQNFRCFLDCFQAFLTLDSQLIHIGEQSGNIRLHQLRGNRFQAAERPVGIL